MVFHDDYNSHNQTGWSSRIERERQKLSVSVEETLGEETVWRENKDFYWGTEASMRLPVPPYSKQDVVHLSTGSPPDKSLPPFNQKNEERRFFTMHQPGVLQRFAQRLTSSLAAFGVGRRHTEKQEAAKEAQANEQQRENHQGSIAGGGMKLWEHVDEFLPGKADSTQIPKLEMTGNRVPFPTLHLPAHPEGQAHHARTLRLAGHITKIRLETPALKGQQSEQRLKEVETDKNSMKSALSASTMLQNGKYKNERQMDLSMSMRVPSIPEGPALSGVASMYMPAIYPPPGLTIHKQSQEFGNILCHNQIEQKIATKDTNEITLPNHPVVKRATPFTSSPESVQQRQGSGVFEAGQRDAIVMNKFVTTSSVVIVTLTSNPGPVVVQYVSLQPGVGFTVHLTAPASIQAPFNYVLMGEL